MPVLSLHQPELIEQLLRRNIYLHLYAIGDLDEFFWPYTTWYAWQEHGHIGPVVLLYTATEVPTLLAQAEQADPAMERLLRELQRLLPRQIYVHTNPELVPVLARSYDPQSHGIHYKMALEEPARLVAGAAAQAVPLSAADRAEMEELYAQSYPDNWFDPRMLETGQYYGIRRDDALVSVAGIHVYSPRYRVAALGNITTHPRYRGQGLGQAVTARLCQELLQTVDHIGLNVKADNIGAIKCYQRIGFRIVATYEEVHCTGR